MTLQTKFAVLLGLLGLTVAVSLGATLYFGMHLERELVWPIESTTGVLRTLGAIKREVEGQSRLLPMSRFGNGQEPAADEPGAATPEERYGRMTEGIRRELRTLDAEGAFEARAGVSNATNLKNRIGEAQELARLWFSSGEEEAGRRVAQAHFELRELIERIEARILSDVGVALAYGHTPRLLHRLVLGLCVVATLLYGALAAVLVRRWVVVPVNALRRATQEFSRGNLAYRVPLAPNAHRDELGLLGTEVNQMARTIAGMQEEAVERERLAATGQMVRRLVHNLRNPLAGIRSIAELSRRRAGDSPQIRQEQTEIMLAVDRFNTWLSELLDVTAPVSVRPRSVPTGEWLAGILDSHRPLARMRSVELRTETEGVPPLAEFDPKHMEHAMVAILTNAIQASPNGGVVRLQARRCQEDEAWEISVQDQGPGVPPGLEEKIFRPYFTTKPDGNGIGLAVAQQVVRQHGGRISVESPAGGGAVFRIWLPRRCLA